MTLRAELTDLEVHLLRLLVLATMESFYSTIMPKTPHQTQVQNLHRNVRPGDLVMESTKGYLTAARLDKEFVLESVGIYLGKEERYHSWEDEPGGYTDTVHLIWNFLGGVTEWYNCDFIRIRDWNWRNV